MIGTRKSSSSISAAVALGLAATLLVPVGSAAADPAPEPSPDDALGSVVLELPTLDEVGLPVSPVMADIPVPADIADIPVLPAEPAAASQVAPIEVTPLAMQRTGQEFKIVRNDAKAVADAYKAFLNATNVPIGWSGGNVANCTPGSMSPAAKNATFTAINYFRAMADVSPVPENEALSATAQKLALIMHANKDRKDFNGSDWHHPPKEWNCMNLWTADNSVGEILWPQNSPNVAGDYIKEYIDDWAPYNANVGHRSNLIGADVTSIGMGSTSHFTGGRMTFTSSVAKAVAWPGEGYFPWQLRPIQADGWKTEQGYWSYEVKSDSTLPTSVSVTGPDGKALAGVSKVSAQQDAAGNWLPAYQARRIVWKMPKLPQPAPGTTATYTIKVSNGATVITTYDVKLIDAANPPGNNPTAPTAPAAPTSAQFEYSLTAKPYSGAAQGIAIQPKAGVGSVQKVYYNGSTTLPTNAGTYAVKIDVAAGAQYSAKNGVELGDFKINKATPTNANLDFSVPTVTYSGTPQGATATSKPGALSVGTVTVYYAGVNDTVYPKSTNKPTNAGTYAVTVDVSGNANYNARANQPLPNLKINKATPTNANLNFSVAAATYNGTPQGATVTSKPGALAVGTVKVYYAGVNATTYPKSTNKPTNAGTYAVTVDVSGNANYNARANQPLGNFKINKATPTKAQFGCNLAAQTYNGQPKGVNCNPVAGIGSITAIYYGTSADIGTAKKPSAKGTYYVRVSVAEGANYKARKDVVVGTFKIA